MATTALDSLLVKVTADIKDYSSKMGEVESKGTKSFAAVGKAALGIAAGITAAGAALGAMAVKAAATTDRVDKMSQTLGLSRQGFQEWDYVLSQSGVEIDSMTTGLKSMTMRVDESMKGIGEGALIFDRLGISVMNANGELKSQEELFNESVTALQGVTNETERAALANDLFGRSGQALAPLLNTSADSVENLKNKANELGMVLSDDAVDSGVVFTDTLDTLKRSVGALFTNIGADLIPVMQGFAEWIIANMPEIKAVFTTVFEVIGTIVGTFISLIGNVISWLGTWRDNNEETLTAIWGFFEKTFKLIGDIVSAFVSLFEGDWSGMWESIKDIASGAMELVLDVLSGFISAMFNVGKELFSSLWDGLKSVWQGIYEWVSDKISWLIDKLTFWKSGTEEMGGSGTSSTGTTTTSSAQSAALAGMNQPIVISVSSELLVDGQTMAGVVSDYQGLATSRMGLN